jgi:integration host factor subunit alpha
MLDTQLNLLHIWIYKLEPRLEQPQSGMKGEDLMALTKDNIINEVYLKLGLKKNQAREVVEQLLEIMKRTLANGEDLLISGFGKFVVKEKRARRGRNPQTRKDLQLRARRVVVFKTSGILRKKINSS